MSSSRLDRLCIHCKRAARRIPNELLCAGCRLHFLMELQSSGYLEPTASDPSQTIPSPDPKANETTPEQDDAIRNMEDG